MIFLHREHSLQPFSRHYSHSRNPFLDLLEVVGEGGVGGGEEAKKGDGGEKGEYLFERIETVGKTTNKKGEGAGAGEKGEGAQIQIPPPHLSPMLSLLRSYKLVKSLGILHSISYTSIDEYLFLLRGVSRVMGTCKDGEGKALGRRGMYYLAAAVSDFFIPTQRMVSRLSLSLSVLGGGRLMGMGGAQSEHKIQSGKGSLIIEMDQVPKVLKSMVDEWSNDGYIVSFKVRSSLPSPSLLLLLTLPSPLSQLETDPSLIIPKSLVALTRYGHQVVIGNCLTTRKHEVVFVEKNRETWVKLTEEEEREREIEEDIVGRLVGMHGDWIEGGK